MPIKKIKIFNSRYNNVLTLFDFIIINGFCFIYVKFISSYPYPTQLLVGLIYSLIFITLGSLNKTSTVQLHKNGIRKSIQLIFSVAISAALTLSIYSTIIFILDQNAKLDIISLAVTLAKSSILLFIFLFSLRLLVSHFLIPKSINVAIFGITHPGLAIEQALRKEYVDTNLDISFYEDRQLSRDSRFVNVKYAGTSRDLLQLAKEGKVDEVYIALPMVAQARIRQLLDDFSDSTVDVFLVPDLISYSSHISQLRMLSNIQTISIFTSPFEDEGALIKRFEDIVLGALFTLASLPLMLFAIIGIKLTSPGPVLFKQRRYGLNGKEIEIWKFRTMNVMENSSVVTQATRDDPRITRFGAFLRKTSLDELPQFFNVLQGTMSIVGPRPHAVAHNEEYRRLVENYMIRHKVKPGITGLAQINGFRGETDTLDKMEKRVQYDLEYIKSWSLCLDIKIVILTFFRGFVGKNAF